MNNDEESSGRSEGEAHETEATGSPIAIPVLLQPPRPDRSLYCDLNEKLPSFSTIPHPALLHPPRPDRTLYDDPNEEPSKKSKMIDDDNEALEPLPEIDTELGADINSTLIAEAGQDNASSTGDVTASSPEEYGASNQLPDARWQLHRPDQSGNSNSLQDEGDDETSIQVTGNGGDINWPGDAGANIANNSTVYEQEQNEYGAIIPEAFLVEERENEAIIQGYAEPLLPWWKQRRMRLLLVAMFVIVATLATALGVYLSKPPPPVVFADVASSSPSVSKSPSLSPSEISSLEPSSSLRPTPMPTTLMQNLKNNQKMAFSENYMVEVAREPRSLSSLHIIFYMVKDGKAEIVNVQYLWYCGGEYDVALDGDRATIDVHKDCCGHISRVIYERDHSGLWDLVDNDMCHPEHDMAEDHEASESAQVEGAPPDYGVDDVDLETGVNWVVILVIVLCLFSGVVVLVCIFQRCRHRGHVAPGGDDSSAGDVPTSSG